MTMFVDLEADTREGQAAGLRLRLYRLQSERRAEELAAVLGVSKAAFYRYEAGDVIKIETARHIAQMLGVSVACVLSPLSRVEKERAIRFLLGSTTRIVAHGTVAA